MQLTNQRILIETKPGLGDTIMTTPALYALKKMFSSLSLSMLVRPVAVPLFDRLPFISHVYAYPKGNACKALRLIYDLAKQDAVIFTTWSSPWARLLPHLHIPFRAGVCKEEYAKRDYFTKNLHGLDGFGDIYRAQAVAKQMEEALEIDLPIEPQLMISDPKTEESSSLDRKLRTGGVEG